MCGKDVYSPRHYSVWQSTGLCPDVLAALALHSMRQCSQILTTHLGSTVDSTGYSSTDILRRVGLASSVMGQLDRVWRQTVIDAYYLLTYLLLFFFCHFCRLRSFDGSLFYATYVNIVILFNFVVMEFGREPDIIKNSLQSTEEEFGPNLIRLRVTQQIRELQTVIRDKCVLFFAQSGCW